MYTWSRGGLGQIPKPWWFETETETWRFGTRGRDPIPDKRSRDMTRDLQHWFQHGYCQSILLRMFCFVLFCFFAFVCLFIPICFVLFVFDFFKYLYIASFQSQLIGILERELHHCGFGGTIHQVVFRQHVNVSSEHGAVWVIPKFRKQQTWSCASAATNQRSPFGNESSWA